MNMSAAIVISMPMMAGGYLTNTNQSIRFLRNPAREASVGTDGVYYNPAGVAFMNDGWHLELDWQMVRQHRDTWSDYVVAGTHLFAMNKERPTTEADGWRRKSRGMVNVPVQPSLFVAYNKDGWSLQFGSGFIGGGGSCEFADGVASFEYLGATLGASALSAQKPPMTGYGLDTYMKGTSYDLGLSLAAARRVTKDLSVSAGLRGVFAINRYEGYLENIRVSSGQTDVSLTDMRLRLDCRQNGFGLTPMLGVDYRINKHFNVAAKYEFRTSLTVRSTSSNNAMFNRLASSTPAFSGYLDGAETRQDIPALLSVGVRYSPIETLRVGAGYHHYFDTDTRQWFESQTGNTNEFTLGIEYDVTKCLEVSAGCQKTIYDQTSGFHTDTNFNLDAFSYGLGIGLRVTKHLTFNASWFGSVYEDFHQHEENAMMSKNVTYSRTNRVIGIGMELDF